MQLEFAGDNRGIFLPFSWSESSATASASSMIDANDMMANNAEAQSENGASTELTTPANDLGSRSALAAAASFDDTAANGTTLSFSISSSVGRVSPRLAAAAQYSPTGDECPSGSDVLLVSYHELTMLLAEEVEKYPCLYGIPSEEDKNDTRGTLGARQAAWKRVADAVGIPAEECQKRFKNLRDRFVKAVKEHAATGSEPRYRYYKRLDYLRPSVRKRSSFGVEVLKGGGRVSVSSEQLDAAPQNGHDFAPLSSFSAMDAVLAPLRGSSSPVQATSSSSAAPAAGQSPVRPPIATRELSRRAPASDNSPAKRQCVVSAAAAPAYASAQPMASGLAGDAVHVEENATEHHNLSRAAADDTDLFLASLGSQMRMLSPQVNALVKLRVQEVLYYAQYPPASDASPS